MYSLHFQQNMDQPGMVVNPARGQLNKEKVLFPRPRSYNRPRNWPREAGSAAVPSRLSLLILHTQTEYISCLPTGFLTLPATVSTYIPSTAIGSVPINSLLGHAIACRWRSLSRVRRHRARSPQGSSSNGCCLVRFHHLSTLKPIGHSSIISMYAHH